MSTSTAVVPSAYDYSLVVAAKDAISKPRLQTENGHEVLMFEVPDVGYRQHRYFGWLRWIQTFMRLEKNHPTLLFLHKKTQFLTTMFAILAFTLGLFGFEVYVVSTRPLKSRLLSCWKARHEGRYFSGLEGLKEFQSRISRREASDAN